MATVGLYAFVLDILWYHRGFRPLDSFTVPVHRLTGCFCPIVCISFFFMQLHQLAKDCKFFHILGAFTQWWGQWLKFFDRRWKLLCWWKYIHKPLLNKLQTHRCIRIFKTMRNVEKRQGHARSSNSHHNRCVRIFREIYRPAAATEGIYRENPDPFGRA